MNFFFPVLQQIMVSSAVVDASSMAPTAAAAVAAFLPLANSSAAAGAGPSSAADSVASSSVLHMRLALTVTHLLLVSLGSVNLLVILVILLRPYMRSITNVYMVESMPWPSHSIPLSPIFNPCRSHFVWRISST
jgi:hypothetical protein